jgi:hypothetical protein
VKVDRLCHNNISIRRQNLKAARAILELTVNMLSKSDTKLSLSQLIVTRLVKVYQRRFAYYSNQSW